MCVAYCEEQQVRTEGSQAKRRENGLAGVDKGKAVQAVVSSRKKKQDEEVRQGVGGEGGRRERAGSHSVTTGMFV